MNLYFTKYRISTITSNAKLFTNDDNLNINLIELFNNITIDSNDTVGSFIYTSRFENKNSTNKIVRGNYIKKKRTICHKRTFDNQISFVYKLADNHYVNVKVFQNGSLHITGSRTIEDIDIPLKKLVTEIKENKIQICNNIEDLQYGNIQILMINTDFKIFKDIEHKSNFAIKRRTLHSILIQDYNMIARFDPSTYPGVKIEYWWNDQNNVRDASIHYDIRNVKSKSNIKDGVKKITIAVFESGSILITGAITVEQVNETYDFICNIIEKNKDLIYFNI